MKSPLALLKVLALLPLAILLSSCATSSNSAIVRQVETTESPVKAATIATKHFGGVINGFAVQMPTITPAEAGRFATLLQNTGDASEACAKAFKRVRKVDTLTAKEAAELREAFKNFKHYMTANHSSFTLVERRAEEFLADNRVFNVAGSAIYWFDEARVQYNAAQAKKYIIKG